MKIFQVLKSSKQMHNGQFHVLDRIRTAAKFIEIKIAQTRRPKLPVFLFFSLLKMQISYVLVVTVVVVT